jgi:hypothetical protein
VQMMKRDRALKELWHSVIIASMAHEERLFSSKITSNLVAHTLIVLKTPKPLLPVTMTVPGI